MSSTFGPAVVLTEGNTPGQRNRMMRKLSALEWRGLYGHRYIYSSDYIHSHRHAFAKSTRIMARAANVTEELAEAASCITGMHIRFVGSLVPGTLRELSGKARFLSRLQYQIRKDKSTGLLLSAALNKSGGALGDRLEQLFSKLCEQGLINPGKAHLTCDLRSAQVQRTIETAVCEVLQLERDSKTARSYADCLTHALEKADMRLQWKAWSKRRRVAHVAGCMLAMFSSVGISLALAPAAAWAAGPYVTGMLGLAGALYACSFALRTAATVQARCVKTYRGDAGAHNRKAYRSLYEALRAHSRSARNAVYAHIGLPGPPGDMWVKDECGRSFQSLEFASYSFSSSRRAGKAMSGERRYARWLVGLSNDLADLVYQGDSILARMAGRSIRMSFASQAHCVQIAGHTGGGFAGYDWYTSAAQDVRLGKARLTWARFAGIGGADVLGGAVGCLAIACAWGAVSKFSGGVVPAVMLGGVGFLRPVSGLALPAMLWTASLLLEAPLPLIRKMSDARRGQPGRDTSMSTTA